MPYTITTHTTDGGKHVYATDSLDVVDQFVSNIRYRDGSNLLAVSDSPITLTYAANVKWVTIEGVTKEEIAAREKELQEKMQAAYQEQFAAKGVAQFANQCGTIGGQLMAGNAFPAPSGLASVVR